LQHSLKGHKDAQSVAKLMAKGKSCFRVDNNNKVGGQPETKENELLLLAW